MRQQLFTYIKRGLLSVLAIVLVSIAWIYINRTKINRSIEEAISTQINGKFTFDGVSLRPLYKGVGLTFVFRDVAIQDTVLLQPILQAKRVGVRVSLGALFNQERLFITSIILEDGKFDMIRSRNGYMNINAFYKKHSLLTSSTTRNEIFYSGLTTQLLFDHMRVSYYDSVKQQSHAGLFQNVTTHIDYRDQVLACHLKGALVYEGLLFNKEKGAFLKNKATYTDLKFAFYANESTIELAESTITLEDKYPVQIRGEVYLGNKKKEEKGNYTFTFSTQRIPAQLALSHLTSTLEKKIGALNILPIVDAKVVLKGGFQQKHPYVEVKFETDTFNYNIKDIALNQLRAKGYYTSQVDRSEMPSDSNSQIVCTEVVGLFESLPIQASINVNNLLDPRATITYAMQATMYDLNKMLDPTKYKIKEGELELEGMYEGSLKQLYDPLSDQFNGHLLGKISVKNLAGEFLVHQLAVSNINTEMQFDNRSICFDDFSFRKQHDQHPMLLKGEIQNIISSLLGGDRPILANLSVYTEHWDLSWIDRLSPPAPKNSLATTDSLKNSFKSTDWIERIVGKFDVEAELIATEVAYQRFLATNVKGYLRMNKDRIELHSLEFNAFNGDVALLAGIKDLSKQKLPSFYLNGTIKNTNVKEVFYGLGNFGQTTLTDQNLEGNLNAKFSLSGELLQGGNIAFPSLSGKLDFTLLNGRIINFGPFLKIKKIIFKNRNLEDVQFNPISTSVILKGEDIYVNNLSVSSNVLSFVVSGIYSFVERTNLSIRIPISNLRSTNRSFNAKKSDNEKAIYLKAFEQNGSVQIMLDGKKSLR